MDSIPDLIVFLTIWDEEYGPQKVATYPTSTLDIESLGALIFTAFQYFWDSPEKSFEKSNFTLPLETHGRKIRVVLQTLPNDKVRGGLQPYATSLILPDHLPDTLVAGFDPILTEIGLKYANTKEVSLPLFEKRLYDYFHQALAIPVPPEPASTYPFSAAVEDFQTGVRMLKEGAATKALPSLLKALGRFEADTNTKLTMETIYLLASSLTQVKNFQAARAYFRRLKPLAQGQAHQNYSDLATFMEAFCASKLGDHQSAADLFSSMTVEENKSINPLQFHALYGMSLSKLGCNTDAIIQLRKALELCQVPANESTSLARQRAQILYELAMLYYNDGIRQAERSGFQKSDTYRPLLTQSWEFCTEVLKIWDSLNDFSNLFHGYQILGSLLSLLDRHKEAILMYEKSLALFEEHKVRTSILPLFDKIMQLRARLGLYQENARAIRKFLAITSSYTFLDILSLASYQEMAGDAFANSGDLGEASKEYLRALEVYQQLKQPPLEMVSLLQKLVHHFERASNPSRVAEFRDKLLEIQTKVVPAASPPATSASLIGTIKELWIFHSYTGSLLFGIVKETRVDSDLLGGFLTALQEFSLNLSRQRLDTMVIGLDRFTFHYEVSRDIYILGRAPARVLETQVKSVLLKIYNRFWREYSRFLSDFSGDTKPFESFGKILVTLDFSENE